MKKRPFVGPEIFTIFLIISLAGCQNGKTPKDSKTPERVVSFTPAITETVFALGADAKLVGVTRHCAYPPAAREKTSVGSLFEPNYEALLALRPDCVLIPEGNDDVQKFCEKHQIRVVALPQRTVEDVFSTLSILGTLFEQESKSAELTESLRKHLNSIRGTPPRRVLFVLSRNFESRDLEEVYIAGKDDLCAPLLKLAGGENVYQGSSAYPKISPEAVLRWNPDVILESVPKSIRERYTDAQLRAAWSDFSQVTAVRQDAIYFLDDDPPLLPSPSMAEWTEKTARILHP